MGSNCIVVEYIWLSGANTHHDIRSKCRTLYISDAHAKLSPTEMLGECVFPDWNFDGSSTAQAAGKNTEIVIKPVAAFHHPFARDFLKIAVLAECYEHDCSTKSIVPTKDNTRCVATSVFNAEGAPNHKPWFGMEQEYVLIKNGLPLGWPKGGFPAPQGPYYCANGHNAYGRKIVIEHYEKCLKMGLKISGINAEVMPGQWEYQVGPCLGIEAGDHLVLSRWVYLRVLEDFSCDLNQLSIDYSVKPIKGDWNGSGLHTNFSTEKMREPDGLVVIEEAVNRMKNTVADDIPFYGQNNNERMTGLHETSSLNEFTWGIGTRHTSVRIGNDVNMNRCGYLEDRRPGSDADPYILTARLFSSACDIPAPKLKELIPKYTCSWMLGQ